MKKGLIISAILVLGLSGCTAQATKTSASVQPAVATSERHTVVKVKMPPNKPVSKIITLATGDDLYLDNHNYSTGIIFSGFVSPTIIQFIAEIDDGYSSGVHYGTFSYTVRPNQVIMLENREIKVTHKKIGHLSSVGDGYNDIFPIPIKIKILALYPNENKIKVLISATQ
ncbi:MAG: hypothetical protein ABF586_12400 [Sporolactobacillus sp.]